MKLYKQQASGYTEEINEGFNGWAFLFGPLWYLSKGMIGRAILVVIGVILLSIPLSWVGAVIGWLIVGATANRSYEDYLVKKGYSIVSHKENQEQKKEEKKEIKKGEVKHVCEYCDREFKSNEVLQKHHETCEEKKYREEKNNKIGLWAIGIIFFVGFGIYFLMNNKINLVPLFLIGFLLTPFFDKLFSYYKKRINKLKHFEFNWWKKAVLILIVILVFILINLIIPECPTSCNDNKLCTNDFCSKETGYKCMNTIKLNCNGNAICESGEYGTSDCPNCDDGKKCTADSYDIGAKKCINIEMKGCIQ